MQLEAVIHDLLFNTDCLVIPQFGGLVAKQKSAWLNSQLHLVYPPSKTFGFNPHIKESDGLLYSVVASLKNVRFEEAKTEVDSWVLAVKKKLADGTKVNWEGIGVFFQDHGGSLQFIPNQQANFLIDTLHFHKIALTPLVKEQIVPIHKTEEHSSSSSWVWKAAAAMALPILGVGIFAISQKIQQTDWKYASFKLFGTKSRIATFNPSQTQSTIAWNDAIEEETAPVIQVKEVETDSINENPTPKNTNLELANTHFQYDIIVGAFSVERNATKYMNKLKANGFDAYIAGYGKNGLLMVAAVGSNSHSEAISNLDLVQSKLNTQAWINEN
jgi:cell division septation protein DedD